MDITQDIISLSDFSQQGSVLDGIDRGLASIEAGQGIDAEDFFG